MVDAFDRTIIILVVQVILNHPSHSVDLRLTAFSSRPRINSRLFGLLNTRLLSTSILYSLHTAYACGV